MKNKICFLILFLFIHSTFVYSQQKKNKFKGVGKNAISLNILGVTPIIGISYERLLFGKLSLEAGAGLHSAGGGIKFFPAGVRWQKAILSVGVNAAYLNIDGSIGMFQYVGTVYYFPVGLIYFGKSGFNFGIDLGPGFGNDGYENLSFPFGNIKFGKRF